MVDVGAPSRRVGQGVALVLGQFLRPDAAIGPPVLRQGQLQRLEQGLLVGLRVIKGAGFLPLLGLQGQLVHLA